MTHAVGGFATENRLRLNYERKVVEWDSPVFNNVTSEWPASKSNRLLSFPLVSCACKAEKQEVWSNDS